MADRAAGFTLLELLIAFVILSAGLVAVQQIYAGAVTNRFAAADQSTALDVAESVLTQFKAGPVRPGTFEGIAPSGQKWSVDAVAFKPRGVTDEAALPLLEVAVTVESKPGRAAIRLKTILPAKTTAADEDE